MAKNKKDQGKEMPKADKSMAGKDTAKTKAKDEDENLKPEDQDQGNQVAEKLPEEKLPEPEKEPEKEKSARNPKDKIYVQIMKNINDFRHNRHYECTQVMKEGKYQDGKPLQVTVEEFEFYGPRLMKEVRAPKKKKEDDAE